MAIKIVLKRAFIALAMLLACVPMAHGVGLVRKIQATSTRLGFSGNPFGQSSLHRLPQLRSSLSDKHIVPSIDPKYVSDPYEVEYIGNGDKTHTIDTSLKMMPQSTAKKSQWSQVWNDMRRAMGLGLLTVFGYKVCTDLPEEAQQSFGPYVETKLGKALDAMQSTRTKCTSDIDSLIKHMRCR